MLQFSGVLLALRNLRGNPPQRTQTRKKWRRWECVFFSSFSVSDNERFWPLLDVSGTSAMARLARLLY